MVGLVVAFYAMMLYGRNRSQLQVALGQPDAGCVNYILCMLLLALPSLWPLITPPACAQACDLSADTPCIFACCGCCGE
eukprot:SAG31_NODE_4910_length_2872_cov_2.604039_2_plen_79_part_00